MQGFTKGGKGNWRNLDFKEDNLTKFHKCGGMLNVYAQVFQDF